MKTSYRRSSTAKDIKVKSESASRSVVFDSLQPRGRCSLPGSSVHGILQTGILVWATIPFPRDFPNPRIKPGSPALQADSLPSEPPGKPKRTELGSPLWADTVNLPHFPRSSLRACAGPWRGIEMSEVCFPLGTFDSPAP